MKRKLLSICLLLPLLACSGKTPPGKPAPKVAAADATPCADCYTLQVTFHGLIGFAEDTSKKNVWAFLPKTEYNPMDPKPEALPPGLFDELSKDPTQRADFLNEFYPQHITKIWFEQAVVEGCATPDPHQGCSIAGSDITFDTGDGNVSTLGKVTWDETISTSDVVIKSRKSATADQAQLKGLDSLDPALTKPMQSSLDRRLAARVLINFGEVTSNPFTACGKRVFSFNLPTESPERCADDSTPQELAEEVIVKKDIKIGADTIIRLGGSEKIVVRPKDGAKLVKIEIVNMTPEGIAGTNPCGSMFHGPTFRWLYGLARPENLEPTRRHYFPCKVAASHGGDKCPVKLFPTVGGGV